MKVIDMNKDIRSYKAKTFFNLFSGREFLCLTSGAGFFWLIKSTLLADVSMFDDTAGFVMILCMLPFIAFGWITIYGMHLETFLKIIWKTLLSPSIRVYDNGLKPVKKHIKTKKSKNKELKKYR